MASETSLSSAAAPGPAVAPVPLAPERPDPGSFRYLPYGTQWTWCSKENPGDPRGHYVLVLPCEDPDPANVNVVFVTTKDVVECTSAKSWACMYVPFEGQLHPWRDAIPLAQGCVAFPKPSSINVDSIYSVAWRDLEDVNFTSPGMRAPCLPAEVLDELTGYVWRPKADINTPYKIVPPKVQAKNRARQIVWEKVMATTMPASTPAPVLAAPRQNIPPAYLGQRWR